MEKPLSIFLKILLHSHKKNHGKYGRYFHRIFHEPGDRPMGGIAGESGCCSSQQGLPHGLQSEIRWRCPERLRYAENNSNCFPSLAQEYVGIPGIAPVSISNVQKPYIQKGKNWPFWRIFLVMFHRQQRMRAIPLRMRNFSNRFNLLEYDAVVLESHGSWSKFLSKFGNDPFPFIPTSNCKDPFTGTVKYGIIYIYIY